MITLKLVRSPIGCNPKQRETLAALGLRRMHMVRTYKDTLAIRGMIAKIPHLVEVIN